MESRSANFFQSYYAYFENLINKYKSSGDGERLSKFRQDFIDVAGRHEVESRFILRTLMEGAILNVIRSDSNRLNTMVNGDYTKVPRTMITEDGPYGAVLNFYRVSRDRCNDILNIALEVSEEFPIDEQTPRAGFQKEIDRMEMDFAIYDGRVRDLESLSQV